jgi:hypothetical protein
MLQTAARRRAPVALAAALALLAAGPAQAAAIRALAAGPTTGSPGQSELTARLGPDAVTDGPAHVSTTAATLRGSLTPGAAAASYEFQLGTTTAYGIETTQASLGPSSVATAVSFRMPGLQAGTIYHYRLVASSADGTSYGQDQTFSTALPSPQRIAVAVTPVGAPQPPYQYTVAGEMILPPGVSSDDGCDGYVTVDVIHGRRPLVVQWATIDAQCRYRTSVTVPSGARGAHGRVAITVRFLGSRVLAARVSDPVFVTLPGH